MTGIRLDNTRGMRINGGHFKNLSVGIQARNSHDLRATGATFDNVDRPYDLRDSDGEITGSRITNDPKIAQPGRTAGKSHSGWRRTVKGPPLPAYCPRCRSIFPSANYDMSGQFYMLWDNHDTCPECNFQQAELCEGIFNLTKQAVEIIRSPELTHSMLKDLTACAENTISGMITPEQFVATTRRADRQRLYALAKRYASYGNAAVLFLAGVVTLIGTPLLIHLALSERGTNSKVDEHPTTATEHVLRSFSGFSFRLDGVYRYNKYDRAEGTTSPPSKREPESITRELSPDQLPEE